MQYMAMIYHCNNLSPPPPPPCREAYPEAPVQDIKFAYNITTLVKLDKKR